MNSASADVFDFWFGPADSDLRGTQHKKWFQKSDQFDEEIRQQFGGLVQQALDGDLSSWTGSQSKPADQLAFILLLDQFTRNIYRDTPKMYAGDEQALATAQAMVASGADQQLLPVERSFCYLPYEHAEDIAMQDESLRLFASVNDDPVIGGILQWAESHRDVVVRFGRFPHRNAILGRTSSAEEIAFLSQPGSSF